MVKSAFQITYPNCKKNLKNDWVIMVHKTQEQVLAECAIQRSWGRGWEAPPRLVGVASNMHSLACLFPQVLRDSRRLTGRVPVGLVSSRNEHWRGGGAMLTPCRYSRGWGGG